MSEEAVLAAVQDIARRFDELKEEVEELKRERSSHERTPEPGHSSTPRDRSRSPHHQRIDRSSFSSARPSWASRMDVNPEELPDYSAEVQFDASEMGGEDIAELTEVSDETHQLLTTVCTRSVSNEKRKRIRSDFPLPKVPATRSPNLDAFIRPELSQTAKSQDKELAVIQSLVLDAVAPLTALLEHGSDMTPAVLRETSLAAVALIGNANARISRLRREKILTAVNKSLLPLAKEDEVFTEAPPNLFGSEFARKSKEFIEQLRAIRSAAPYRSYQNGRGGASYYQKRPPYSKGDFNTAKKYIQPSSFRGRNRLRMAEPK